MRDYLDRHHRVDLFVKVDIDRMRAERADGVVQRDQMTIDLLTELIFDSPQTSAFVTEPNRRPSSPARAEM